MSSLLTYNQFTHLLLIKSPKSNQIPGKHVWIIFSVIKGLLCFPEN